MRDRPNFEKLRVYRASEEIADRIWDVVLKWPILARDTVGKQITRAADSIGANIAEGVGRGTYRDNKRFTEMARGSLNETIHFLRRAYKRRLLPRDEVDKLKEFTDALGPMLNAYLKTIRARARDNRMQPTRRSDNS